jgi:hypothetical protein
MAKGFDFKHKWWAWTLLALYLVIGITIIYYR